VADSACSATAYLGGVKANEGTIGVNAKVSRGNCEQMQDDSTHVYSIAKKFLDNGRSAGDESYP
jgi:alkaline phosphatase